MEKDTPQQQLNRVEQNLKPYIKMEKNTQTQYALLKQMLQSISDEQGIMNSRVFSTLFNGLSEEIRQLPTYEYLSYKLWLNDSFPAEIRQKTRFFTIVFDWIVKFEMRVGKLAHYDAQFELITEFIKSNTKTAFQRVIFLQEVYDDLQELIPGTFWEQKTIHDIIQPLENQEDMTQQDAVAILNFLEEVVFYEVICLHLPDNSQKQETLYVNKTLNQVELKNYTAFILNCIKTLLTTSSFDSTVQTNLTRVALKFLHRELPPLQTLKIVKSLMVKTSKAVRYALVIEYVQFYEFLEKSNNDTVIQQLENSIYFRELIIGRRQVEEAEVIKHDLSCVDRPIHVKARVKERLYFCNQGTEQCILRIQLFIQNGDISFRILFFSEKQGKETTYYEQVKTTDTRIEMKLKHRGLYAIEFDNTYSWINGKNIILKMDQFYQLQRTEQEQVKNEKHQTQK